MCPKRRRCLIVIDELKLYRGENDYIGKIEFHPPTLREIVDFGETDFFAMVYQFCATPYDFMSELDDQGIRYEDIDEYIFFIVNLFESFNEENTKLIFPNLNVDKMNLYQKSDTGEILRVDSETELFIDQTVYQELVSTLRKIFGFKYNPKVAATPLTRKMMIREAKDRRAMLASKETKSTLMPLVSTMVNISDFKYTHDEVWDMPFFAFMDSVKRVQAVRMAAAMYTGGYFGLKLSEAKEYLDYTRPL